jgi:hypothetical protein
MPLPVLIRIVEAPIFAADGTLQTAPPDQKRWGCSSNGPKPSAAESDISGNIGPESAEPAEGPDTATPSVERDC